jgi:Predicted nucleotide-binding protein containing TIR-like domain
LGLEPYVLQVTGGGGDTLIEALEWMIGKSALSSFGIVLATPDDLGYLKVEKPEDAKPRARQNVIMEMGMLLSSLTRRRCRRDTLNCHRIWAASSRSPSMITFARRCRSWCSGFRMQVSSWAPGQ